MIKHIVMWKITDEFNGVKKDELLTQMKEKLMALPSIIEEIIDFQVDINELSSDAHFDISLTSTFASFFELEAYQINPDHVEVGKFIKSIATNRAVIDATI